MGRFRATPYAKALQQVVLAECPEREDQVVAELARVGKAFAEVPDLGRVLVTPMVAPDVKATILDQVMDLLEIGEPTRRFLHVMRNHYRLEHLDAVTAAFRDAVDRRAGRVRASVEIAGEAAHDERRAIVAALAALTEADVQADFHRRPELLAGFRATIGSQVFDGSLVGQLEQLRRRIATEQNQ